MFLWTISLKLAVSALNLCPLMAQKKPAAAAGLLPIIDHELHLGKPEVEDAPLSPDGKWSEFQKF